MAAGFPILYRDRLYPSSEALYQALRFENNLALHDAIIAQPNGFLAKKKAYEFIDQSRSDWEEVKVEVMESVIRLKLQQHFVVIKSVLDMTFDLNIVERSSKDQFWGAIMNDDGVLVGENVLGMLWMVVREDT